MFKEVLSKSYTRPSHHLLTGTRIPTNSHKFTTTNTICILAQRSTEDVLGWEIFSSFLFNMGKNHLHFTLTITKILDKQVLDASVDDATWDVVLKIDYGPIINKAYRT